MPTIVVLPGLTTTKDMNEEHEGNQRTNRLMPSLSFATLKLISNPICAHDNSVSVNVCRPDVFECGLLSSSREETFPDG